jgi:hypothetical protein
MTHKKTKTSRPHTIAAKILWSVLFDTSNVNEVLMSIYMTISNYSGQKYGIFSFDKYRIVLLASEGCLNRDHVDLLLLNPASAAGIYPTRMTLKN